MKNTTIILMLGLVLCSGFTRAGEPVAAANSPLPAGAVIPLTNESFKQLVFNYEANSQWKYEGKMPAIIDFYADWCGPCRLLSPRIEEIARDYAGKIMVYKVDTEKEKLLAQHMGISGLPTLLFIPVNGPPQVSMGLLPKETLIQAINEVLHIK